MKVQLDLAGELEGALDEALEAAYPLETGATLEDLVASLPFASRVALTSVNGELVPPAERAGRTLSDGDEVMLLPPVKGG